MLSNFVNNIKLPAWLSIIIWIALGISMIMFNKVLLTTWGFRFPFFLTTWHCVLATVLTQILSKTTNMLPGVQKGTVSQNDFIFRILPMSACFAMGLVLGNMAYRYISLAYIQMIKACNPVPLLLLNFACGREKPSIVQLGIVLVVSTGVIMSSLGELNFSWTGFVVQFTAVLSDVCRVMLLDTTMKDLNLDSLSLLYYTAPPSAVMIFVGFLVFEASTLSVDIFTFDLTFMLLLNGLLAFTLNIAVIYLVSSTSGMVMSISGPMKDITIVLSSVVIFGAPITTLQLVGFSVSLFGLYLYRQYKAEPKKTLEYCTSTALCVETYACLCNPAISHDIHAHNSPTSPGAVSMGRSPKASPSRVNARDGSSSVYDFNSADDDVGDGDVELQPFIAQ